MIDTLYVVTCSSPGAPYPTSGAEAPAALQQFIYQEGIKMADIGNLVSHGEIQFASVRKVLSIQSFHHPAKAFN